MFKPFDLLNCAVGEHDYRLVLLAAVICYFTSLTALDLFRLARATRGRPTFWVLLGGVAGGGGVWATHFIAMLGYEPHVPTGFNIPLTVISLLLAIVTTALALGVAVEGERAFRAGIRRTLSGGALLGLGIAAMHYTGTAALEVPARIEWDMRIVIASIAAGVILSTAAIRLARAGDMWRVRIASAAVLTLAIVALHFGGMAALRIIPDPTRTVEAAAFPPSMLAFAIAGVSIALLGIGAITALADRRLRGQALAFDAEIVRLKQSAAWLSRHDILTGLPNRSAFTDHLASAIKRSDEKNKPFALLSINLDRFKDVNDLFGHSVGDQLLQRVAKLFASVAGDGFLARNGGDDFSAIAAEGQCLERALEQASELTHSLAASLAETFEIDGHEITIGLSVGVAIYPVDGDAETIRASADAALFAAKSAGLGNVRYFDRALAAALHERNVLQQDLRRALERNELALHYQPQAAPGGDIVGFEALLRWTHPKRGPISPGVFIPIAEESGLIVAIGACVLREACREAQRWDEPLRIAVNLSPAQFRQDDLPEIVHAILLETGLSPERLELEITEGVLVDDVSRATSILRRLKSLGVGIAIDDFGTGYSSLSYLQSFPFDRIKIDQSFVSKLQRSAQSDAIVRAIINLGHGLGLSVIAEGVETQAQLAFLEAEGCDEIQGYFIGRPAPISAYSTLVSGRAKKQADLFQLTS